MALTLADLLGPLLQRPMMGGPVFGSLLPKAASNVSGGSPPAPNTPPQSSDAQFLAAMTQFGLAGPQAEEARAKAALAQQNAAGLKDFDKTLAEFLAGSGGGVSAPGSIAPPLPPRDSLVAPTQARDMGGGMRAGGALTGDPLALIEKYESGGRNIMQQVVPPEGGFNPSVGRVTGPSTAQGYYQITNSTWRETAPKAGVSLDQYPTAMSAPKEVQAQVAKTLFDEQGFKPWAPYNARLAAAIGQGEGAAPVQMAQAAPQQQTASAFGSLAPGMQAGKTLDPMQLAIMGMRAKRYGLGDIMAPLEKLYYESPQFKAQQHAATKGVDLQYAGPLAGAEESARDSYLRGREQFKADLDLRNKWQSPTDLQKSLLAANINPASPEGREIMRRAFPDNRPDAVRLADAADLPPGQRDQALAGAIPGNAPTADMKEYEAYVKDTQARGQTPMSLNAWDLQRRRSSATMINTAEGFDVAQAKARFTMDTAAAKDIAEQAIAGRRLVPLIDEVVRLADKTPGGWAGPVAATTAKALSGMGFPVPEGLSNAELLQSISQRLVPIVREPGPTSEKELNIYLRATPGLMQSQEGRVKVAEMTKAIINRTNEIAKVYRNNVGAPDLYDKLAALDKPIFSDDQRKALEGAVASAGDAAPSSAAPTAVGPNGQIIILRDGQWVPQ